MKMMGKRVNFAGRSVISPDPYITTDQIGVPEFMAQKLTFPQSVASFNLEFMKELVITGPYGYPGANVIEDENGNKQNLENMDLEARTASAKLLSSGNKTVYRHLLTGDPLLVNRQPTLHKPSIQAHLARVLPQEQTIRMHYANCKAYNADFDGDEMNIHLPQDHISISEALNLAATHKQYIVPTDGSPLRGLIQDFIISAVRMTCKDAYFNKEQYNQLLYVSLRDLLESGKIKKIVMLKPTIYVPQRLWTGKQIVSTIIKNITQAHNKSSRVQDGLNMTSKSKLKENKWGKLGEGEGTTFRRSGLAQRGG